MKEIGTKIVSDCIQPADIPKNREIKKVKIIGSGSFGKVY